MKLTIYGAGYVGLVTGICFAKMGHTVCCVDIDATKINMLKQGNLPIYEENLEDLLHESQKLGRIQFITDFQYAVNFSEIQIIAVGTPPRSDGSANLEYVVAVAEMIGKLISGYCCIVNKSTVPTGTAKLVKNIIQNQLKMRNENIVFDVISNPEFLREGSAVKDCLAPDRIVIGYENDRALKIMQQLYEPLIQKNHAFISMDFASAELTKYAANVFLATKVSFINEISQIAERVGANIHAIKRGIGSDSRINEKFLNAGCGFGGSCFPKDILALKNIAMQNHYEPHILNAVLKTNDQQQKIIFHKITHYFERNLKNKIIAIWGLSFKPNTDDVRSASSCVLMKMLWDAGTIVQAYDPMAMKNIRTIYPDQDKLILLDDAKSVLKNADALVIMTEWNEFKSFNLATIKATLKFPVIFDGRNIIDSATAKKMGFDYFGIGC